MLRILVLLMILYLSLYNLNLSKKEALEFGRATENLKSKLEEEEKRFNQLKKKVIQNLKVFYIN